MAAQIFYTSYVNRQHSRLPFYASLRLHMFSSFHLFSSFHMFSSFLYQLRPKIWNTVPLELHRGPTTVLINRELKTFLLTKFIKNKSLSMIFLIFNSSNSGFLILILKMRQLKKFEHSNKNATMWTGENETKTRKYFASFCLRRGTIYFKNARGLT